MFNAMLTLIIGLIVGYLLPSYAKEKGKNIATKQDIADITRKQEEIKSEFKSIADKQKTDLDKRFKKFELYTVKKHEYYPELYKNIELCIGKVKDLSGYRTVIDFRNFNKDDIAKYMSDKSFTEADKELVISKWDGNKSLAIRDVEYRLQRIEYYEAKEYFITAHNFYLLHRLFFSNEVSLIANRLLTSLYTLWMNYDPDPIILNDATYTEQLIKENEELNDEIDKLSIELFEMLQGELNVEGISE
ncbi:hypothetical protein [Bacillus tropicus]|uniref:hypothetical protein n=1 Tax=Bacillus tropicus TaxID=2026188 RepID=UPI0013D708F3|nr:hypothetical protein [Bacillus tropicus]